MRISPELVIILQYELKAARQQSALLKSGQKYATTGKKYTQKCRRLEQQMKALREKLHRLHQEQLYARQQWLESTDDMQAEYERRIRTLQAENARLYEWNIKAEMQRDAIYDKITGTRREKCQLAAELEEEEGKNQKLAAQNNKDFGNSSFPSSTRPVQKKKIPNNREATGREPGGRPGHPGYDRKEQILSQTVLFQPSLETLDDPDFKKAKETVTKQLINLQIYLNVTEYKAGVYRNFKTGESCRAEFPAGGTDEVNYGSSVKASFFLLDHDCCVFIDKCQDFLKNLTGGKLGIFKEMVSRFSKELVEKSEPERKSAVPGIYLYPVMHIDCTNTRVNGKSTYVFIYATPNGPALYYVCEVKGRGSVAGTLVGDYQGILIHDHEKTFYRYGCGHQEYPAHILRYLKGSVGNEPEPERKRNRAMHCLLREMIHYVNGVEPDGEYDPIIIYGYESRYDQVLETAPNGYADVSYSDYYRSRRSLALRMKEYRGAHLLFPLQTGSMLYR